MSVLLFLIQIVPLLILVFSFYKIELSILLFIFYSTLVPLDGFSLGGIHLGNNFLFLILLFSFLIKYKLTRADILYPFLVLYIFLFIFMLFEYRMNFGEQLNRYRQEIMSVFILPYIIYAAYNINIVNIGHLKMAVLISAIICLLYATLLTFLPYGINPYLIFLEQETDFVYSIEYSFDPNRGIARVFSTMANPQNWALYLGFILYFTLFFVRNNLLKGAMLILVIYNILFCGVRTVIVAATLPLIYYSFRIIKLKHFLYVIPIFFAVVWIITTNSNLYDYFLSFTGSEKSTTAGSDLDMRLYQLQGCLEEIRANPLWGNGFRWSAYYNETFGNHPKAVTFESLFLVILSCWGYAGLIVWGIFFCLLLRRNSKISNGQGIVLNMLVIYYFLFSSITGEYLYIVKFSLFYILFNIFILDNIKVRSLLQVKKNNVCC